MKFEFYIKNLPMVNANEFEIVYLRYSENKSRYTLNILAIIPARQGSKSILDKNIKSLAGKPLMAYSIEQALASKHISRTIVSTDSPYYKQVAESFGAEVPYLRPDVIAGDLTTDLEVFQHTLNWLATNENYTPEIIVHLRPTSPFRKVSDIDAMIEQLIANKQLDSVRSVSAVPHTPYKMWLMQDDGSLKPLLQLDNVAEPYNQPRQALPEVYLQNANIDVMRYGTLTVQNSMTGQNIGGYLMAEFNDIDFQADWEQAERLIVQSQHQTDTKLKTFVVDIDGVVAQLSPNNDYNLSEPNRPVIDAVNRLYEEGHQIVLFTARGSMTGIDWTAVTSGQMQRWGVKHHELRLGKPAANFYVDDRNLSVHEFVQMSRITAEIQ
jgi:CMP-N,N'-diacetyllegionaminic acid synthase